jgi:hypothetical protein
MVTMNKIILVDKTGILKEINVSSKFDVEELYKKCGFKKQDDFGIQHSWSVKMDTKKVVVSVYAKTIGKANNENKYEFPPPIDTELFFGNICIVLHEVLQTHEKETTKLIDLSIYTWNKIYEYLYGGFEDLKKNDEDDYDEDEQEEDEILNISSEKLVKTGYLKDGFVVDDNKEDIEYDEDFDYDEDESYYENDDDPCKNENDSIDESTHVDLDDHDEDIENELTEEEYDT